MLTIYYTCAFFLLTKKPITQPTSAGSIQAQPYCAKGNAFTASAPNINSTALAARAKYAPKQATLSFLNTSSRNVNNTNTNVGGYNKLNIGADILIIRVKPKLEMT